LSDKNLRYFVSQSESCLHHSLRTSAKDEGVSESRNSIPLMNAKRKTGGRPKLAEGKRIRKIDARFTEDEYKLIEELEKTLGIRKTSLVRMRLLENAPNVIINAKELITAIDAIGTELGRCGNNINQFARYVNVLQKQRRSDPHAIAEFNQLFADYLAKQAGLWIALRQVIRLAGR
jgi:mobilization protein NikA